MFIIIRILRARGIRHRVIVSLFAVIDMISRASLYIEYIGGGSSRARAVNC